jgi:hypothetical protein
VSGPAVDFAPVFIGWSGYGSGSTDIGVLNAGATAFNGTLPTGFSAWDTTGATTWDSGSAGAGMTLSGGNLTVTKAAVSTWTSVRSNTARGSGKWYFEITASQISSGHVWGQIFGLVNVSFLTNNYVGSNNALGGGAQSGETALLGLSGSWIGTCPTGTTVYVAVDLTAGLVWFAESGAPTNWNGSTSNSPGGTGGISLSNFYNGQCPSGAFGAAIATGGSISGSVNLSTQLTNDIIYVMMSLNTAAAGGTLTPSVTAPGLTFTQRVAHTAADTSVWTFWAPSTAVLSNVTITGSVTCSGSPSQGSLNLIVFGVHGCGSLSAPFDPNASFPAIGGTPVSWTTTDAPDLVVAQLVNSISSTPPLVSGYTTVGSTGVAYGGALCGSGVGSLAKATAGAGSTSWSAISNFAIIDAFTGASAPSTETAVGTLALSAVAFNVTASDARGQAVLALSEMTFTAGANPIGSGLVNLAIAQLQFNIQVYRQETVNMTLAIANPQITSYVLDLSALTKLRQFTVFG